MESAVDAASAETRGTHLIRRNCLCKNPDCRITNESHMTRIRSQNHAGIVATVFKLDSPSEALNGSVHKQHYAFADFTLCGNRGYMLKPTAIPTVALQMGESELTTLCAPATSAVPPRPHPKGQLAPCPCHKGAACAFRLEDTGKIAVPKDDKVRRKWAKVLIPLANRSEKEDFMSRVPLYINRLHVHKDDLTVQGKLKSPAIKARIFATPREPPADISPRWPADTPTGWKTHESHRRTTVGLEFARVQDHFTGILRSMEDIRKRTTAGDPTAAAAASAIDLQGMPDVESYQAMLDEYESYLSAHPRQHDERCDIDADDVDPVQLKWFLDMLKSSKHLCLYYTGEVSWRALMSIFSWMNCEGALENLRITPLHPTAAPTPSGRPAKARRVGGRVPALTTEQQFVLWIVIFRQLRAHVLVAANLFGVHVNTAWRTYRLWSRCVSVFSLNMMPMLSGAQFHHDTSAEAIGLLGLDKNEGVVVGDVTEVEVCDTSNRNLHSTFHSSKIDRQSIKVLAITSGASYIAHTAVPYPGGISEQKLHECERIAEIFESAFDDPCDGDRIVYNYDRGIDEQKYWVDHRVRIVSADKAQNKQQVFSSQAAKRGRTSAVARIHIERTFEQMRHYSGFNYKRPLSEIDLAECEVECARFLVNLKPCNHNWSQVSFDPETDGHVGETGPVSNAGDADISNMF